MSKTSIDSKLKLQLKVLLVGEAMSNSCTSEQMKACMYVHACLCKCSSVRGAIDVIVYVCVR